MNGILVINKPSGVTSHDVVASVRRILGTRKVGHAGTLDPIATGVLIVLVGKATKLSDRLLCERKRYIAKFRQGVKTDTYDITGTVIEESGLSASRAEILRCIESFKGKISQVPPMYSAIKMNGKKLYELARAGVTVERKPREVEIYDISLVGEDTLDISCSKGTYIRSLIYDMGEALGCGATLTELSRIESGNFTWDNAVTLEELSEKGFEACALTADEVINAQSVTVFGEDERKIKNGNVINFEGVNGECKVFSSVGELLCTAMGDGIIIRPEIMLYEGEL